MTTTRQTTVLVVDDEHSIQEALSDLFTDEGHQVTCVSSGEEAVQQFRKQPISCVFLDIWMPGIDGMETMSRLHNIEKNLPIIMMSGHASIETAVQATRMGAFDYIEKPLSSDRLLLLLHHAIERGELASENQALKKDLLPTDAIELVGDSPAMQKVKTLAAQSASAPDVPVLVYGEHGSGKSVLTHLLHAQSSRAEQPFIHVKTVGIPEKRLESDLFGFEKGSIPGATQSARGKIELANKGSLYLEEITSLTSALQAKVMRAFQDKAMYRIGAITNTPIDVRLFASTSIEPEESLKNGVLRQDFYYHLNVLRIPLPALRERLEDIPALIIALCSDLSYQLGCESITFTSSATAKLQQYNWPGNIRELRNYLERSMILMPGQEISDAMLIPLDHASVVEDITWSDSFHHAKDMFERAFLVRSLQQHQWNISRTASSIGLERSQLHRKIKKLGITPAN